MRWWVTASAAFALAATAQAEPPRSADLHAIAAVAVEREAPLSSALTSKSRFETLTVVIGGDLGFSGSDQPVAAEGARKHGQTLAFADMTRHIAPLLAGDVVFANLETVVTARNDLVAIDKLFNFRSHPLGLRHLVSLGLNVVSLANNHAFDYGPAGLRETLHHVEALRAAGLQAAPGVGMGRAGALAPGVITSGSARVLVGALGIGAGGLPEGAADRPGMASWNNPRDAAHLLAELSTAPGDLRLLSVHYGQEMQLRAAPGDERRLREAVDQHGIDLVVGHHAHVAAGVQSIGGRLVFYGLGNLMHPGMQDMGRHGPCRDYGILARIHYGREPGERFRALAVEIFALEGMHAAPRPRTGVDGRTRIGVLNHLADALDGPGEARGVRFVPQADGRGLFCVPGTALIDGPVGVMCRGSDAVVEPDRQTSIRCSYDVVARRSMPASSTKSESVTRLEPPRARRIAAGTPSDFWAR